MSWFSNMKVGKKIIYSFLLVSAISAFIGFQGLSDMSNINDMLNSLYANETLGLSYVKEANVDLIYFSRAQANLLLASTAEEREKYRSTMLTYEQKMKENIEKAKPLIHNEAGIKLLADFESSWNDYKSVSDKVVELCSSEDLEHARESVRLSQTTGHEKITVVASIMTELCRLKESNGKEAYDQSDVIYSEGRRSLILLIIGGVGIGLVIGFFISRYISINIKKITERMESLSNVCLTNLTAGSESFANGNLYANIETGTKALEVKSNDEFGDLATTLNQMISKTQNTVASVQKAMKTVIDTTSEIGLLVSASEEGKLKVRGNVEKFNGGFKEIIKGLNNTLDTVVAPINEQSDVLDKMSQGDLTVRMMGDYKGDFLIIKNSINKLGESLNNVIDEVNEAVQATASASSQISSSTEEMAAGAQEQSAQTTEVASAVEQMTTTILQTSQNSSSAVDKAKKAGTIAVDGGTVVNQTIDGMNKIAKIVIEAAGTVRELGKSSDQIGEIIQVIDDIADQTNLLALNAAIEAARAGEQGRGFAVVADEVRKLAERTTKATKEIAVMIKQIQKDTQGAVESIELGTQEVESGKQLAGQAGDSLMQIIKATDEVQNEISQVATASEEQSSAAEQISKSIEGISSVTQQSAAGTQQIARAAEDLNRLTDNLQNLIAQFKVSNENGSGVKKQKSVLLNTGKHRFASNTLGVN